MAAKFVKAISNWSTATWYDNSTNLTTSAPGATDDVYANNFAVTIDQSIHVTSLNTTALAANISAGGSFTCSLTSSPTLTIDGSVNPGSSNCLALSHASGMITLNGTALIVNGSATTSSKIGIVFSGAGTLTATATLTGGSQSSASAMTQSAGTFNLTGNVNAGAGASATGLTVSGSGSYAITGTSSGGTSSACNGITSSSSSVSQSVTTANGGSGGAGSSGISIAGGTLTVTNATGGSVAANNNGILISGACTVNVTNVTGATIGGSYGVYVNNASGIANCTNVTAGSVMTAYGVYVNVGGSATCNGMCVATSLCSAIADNPSYTGYVAILGGTITNSTGLNALFCCHLAIASGVTWTVAKPNGTPNYSGTQNLSGGASSSRQSILTGGQM